MIIAYSSEYGVHGTIERALLDEEVYGLPAKYSSYYLFLCYYPNTPRMRSSKALRAALAPSPMAMMICLYGVVATSPAA